MNVQPAAATVLAIAFALPMSPPRAQDTQHEGEHPESSPGLVRTVRQVTQKFQDVNAATGAGYAPTESCVSGPNVGAMGVHYVNEALIADGMLDAHRPEVLVYEPRGQHLQLVAVEYLIDAQQWDAANPGPPVVGGQHLHYVGAPNRLRSPPYYELHVWAWKRNPNGTFADWNPRVSCTQYAGGGQ